MYRPTDSSRSGLIWWNLLAVLAVLLIFPCLPASATVAMSQSGTATSHDAKDDSAKNAPRQVTEASVRALNCASLHTVSPSVGAVTARGTRSIGFGVAANGVARLGESGVVNPSTIRFSQNSIAGAFKDGGGVKDLAAGLRSGAVNPSDIPAIRLVERDGSYFTLDNP